MKRAFITALLIGAATALVAFLAMQGGPPADNATSDDRPADAADNADDQKTTRDDDARDPAGQRGAGEGEDARPTLDDRPAQAGESPRADVGRTLIEPAPDDLEQGPAKVDIASLRVREAPTRQETPKLGGPRDPDTGPDDADYKLHVALSAWGAGVDWIHLVDYSEQPIEYTPYPLQKRTRLPVGDRYPLAARAILIADRPGGDAVRLPLFNQRWRYVAERSGRDHATFEIDIVAADADAHEEADEGADEGADHEADDVSPVVLRLIRTYRVEPDLYDMKLEQRIVNLSGTPLEVRFEQYGQLDLKEEGGYLGDRRTVTMGYFKSATHPYEHVFIDGFRKGRGGVANADDPVRWPTDKSRAEGHELTFAAMGNRYFTAALHAPPGLKTRADGSKRIVATPLSDRFPTVYRVPHNASGRTPIGLAMTSRPLLLESRRQANLDVGLFAGPKAPDVIEKNPLYSALGLEKLIIYNIGGCCAPLTFSWLSHGLLAFLKFLHAGLADWGLAIIVLVVIVRGILHPITKRSQINMQKFGKQMAALQPDVEALKKKHKDNQQKLNQEMMKLYREKGVNPAAMGMGCLPMFLQMPIWIALYAMLFFAIELRHESAFYGVFQQLTNNNWRFLADLSSPDNFIRFPPISVLGLFTLSSFNILPVLMAVVFFFQQKFMTPPQQNVSEQQKQQQKIMRFMMLLFPIFLYKAPSGLTLYILASTCSGILDSYMVRRHIQKEEEAGTLFKPKEKKPPKPGGFMDRIQKAAEAKRSEMEQRQKQLQGKQPQQRRRSGGGGGGRSGGGRSGGGRSGGGKGRKR